MAGAERLLAAISFRTGEATAAEGLIRLTTRVTRRWTTRPEIFRRTIDPGPTRPSILTRVTREVVAMALWEAMAISAGMSAGTVAPWTRAPTCPSGARRPRRLRPQRPA